jgi:3-deoxy-7-phosphoheptulonate synthase
MRSGVGARATVKKRSTRTARIVTPPDTWSIDSWRSKHTHQIPSYDDQSALDDALDDLRRRPPLVTHWEVNRLQSLLAEAAAGKRFILQGGDCAERFDECRPEVITNRLKILLQMSLVLIYGMRRPVARIGRFAGQFAKPRSSDTETRDGQTLPTYRGDIINGPEFTSEARRPDPRRLLDAYSYSALSLNYVRALGQGGFADLHHPEYWNVDFMQRSPLRQEYEALLGAIGEAVGFLEAVTRAPLTDLERVSFFTSHEALHLPYEAALTRHVELRDEPYNLSTHFPWIGMRTAEPDGGHVEYVRGIGNPVAIKVGPKMTADWLRDLMKRVDPENTPGRLTLVTRMGADAIGDHLPKMIATVRAEGRTPLWMCDPMHGNTETTGSGIKTRQFDKILFELEQAFDIHAAEGGHLGGVHFELTGEDVTECTGGARGLSAGDLERAYTSYVDPRLNYEQALEMAFSIVRKCKQMETNA